MVERVWVLAYDEAGEIARFAGCVKAQAAYYRALFEMNGYRVEVEASDLNGEEKRKDSVRLPAAASPDTPPSPTSTIVHEPSSGSAWSTV